MLEKTWRWFGENDPISLREIRQIGVEGIVTALHHIPNGEVWSCEEILKVKKNIEQHGMRWSVVESLPVHEQIKWGGPLRDGLIENYRQSLLNLGQCGVDTVCYNFMPVIDWIRTDLNHQLENGGESLFFDFVDFIVFDRFILDRAAAEASYPPELVEQAHIRVQQMTDADKDRLIDTIIVKTQGFIDGISADNPQQAVKLFKELLKQYEGIDENKLRINLKYFLDAIIPTAEQTGIKLCIHPDDPPMKVLGLPRIVSSLSDIQWILNAVDHPANGLTFCAGSLSAGAHNELTSIIETVANRVYFVHLRSTERCEDGNFYEAEHLKGSVDMPAIMKTLLQEQNRRKSTGLTSWRIPMRVDHGHKLLTDFDGAYNPGYPLIGRLKGLAEIDGLQHGIAAMLNYAERSV
ncbi:mannonate dehydratase [Sunxiuqinia elliptica]|uniref:Mannonate dehydratase n=1 Tax=Sunxiuqinia elliptica TaxID=655355 RepID=A0A1I2GT31_9BACT|nr:mannonate dehydratase [Sunxiuqinia elliptica]SFF21084.1 mannonate dehydratase [Sunxiuqinia elliptica]